FAVPIYTHQMGAATFLESGAVAVALFGLFTVLLRLLGRERFRADVFWIRAGALGVLLIINVCYFTNVLPPLPLAAKAAGVYHLVEHGVGGYTAETEEAPPTLLSRYLGDTPTEHVAPGGTVYAYSSVFAPTALTTLIIHRWQWWDPKTGAWETRFALTYPIAGGADGGYAGYSGIVPKVAGRWRVSVETADGRVIARLPFTLVFASSTPALTTIQL
ncbi:MAG: DUF2914 domain-containing protein, partial [Patescibacteria group bacterium]|nr:DUF2914 domain-containing protein [Patescibacteria group bacterium]